MECGTESSFFKLRRLNLFDGMVIWKRKQKENKLKRKCLPIMSSLCHKSAQCFKRQGHREGEGPGSSPSEDRLLHCNSSV